MIVLVISLLTEGRSRLERPTNTDRPTKERERGRERERHGNESCVAAIPTSRKGRMKRRSTRTHRDDEEEVVDTSADSDATTTKPTSRALKGLESYNKSGNQEDTTKNASGDSHNYRSDPRKFVLRGKQKGRGGVITNSSRGGVSKSASRSTQSGRGTATTRRNHGSNVEWSPSSSSSSSKSSKGSNYHSCSSSNDDDDDDDDDYVDKRGKKRQSGTKKDGRMKKKGGKTEAVESPEVLKAAEFPLTLRVAFIPRKRTNSTTPSAFDTISNGDYAYHKYTSELTTSSTLIEVQKEIESFLPSDLSLVVGKSLFFDSSFKSIHPENYGVISKSKSKHVDPITDDNELLNAISCGGLKLESTPERTEEPKTIEMLETIEEEEDGSSDGEDGKVVATDDEDECNNESRFYYHLDLIVFCIKQDKNTNGPKKKASTDGGTSYEFIRIKLLPLTVNMIDAKREEPHYAFHPKEDENHDFGTFDISSTEFCEGTRYCHIRHMAQQAYINGDNSMRDKISSLSAIFLRMNGTSRKMDKVTSSANLLDKVSRLKNRSRPKVASVGGSKALVIPMSLGWKRDDDPDAVDLDLEDLDVHLQLAAGSQQSNFHGSPLLKKSTRLSRKEKRSATQTSSSEGMQIFQWLYSHKDSPYHHLIPLDLRPSIIQEFSTDTDERRVIMAFIDQETESLEINDFPSIEFLSRVERLAVFFPLNKEYPPEASGLPKFALTSGKAGRGPKTKDELIAEKVGSLIGVVGTLADKLDNNQDREAEFICITQGGESFTLPVSSIKPNRNNGENAAAAAVAAAVSPVAPVAVNRITGLDVLKKFAAETKAKKIGLFPRASPGDIYIYAFDGSEFRSDQFQQLWLKTIIKVTGKERTKKIVMTIKQKQSVEEDFDVGF